MIMIPFLFKQAIFLPNKCSFFFFLSAQIFAFDRNLKIISLNSSAVNNVAQGGRC